MQSLVKRILKQKRVLDAIQESEAQKNESAAGEKEGGLSRWPSQATSDASVAREQIRKFRIIIGWRDNPKGPKKVLVVGGKEYDPYGGRVTIEQSCPKKLANVLSLTTGDELSPRSLRLWEGFIMDLSSVVDMFQDISEDTFLPLFCFCFPCFLVWRSNYLARARSRMLESFVQRHHLSFESAGLLLRYKDITAHLNDCCLDVAQKVTVVEIIWDPSLWTDRI